MTKKNFFDEMSKLWELWKEAKDLYHILMDFVDCKGGAPINFLRDIADFNNIRLGDIKFGDDFDYEIWDYDDGFESWNFKRSKTDQLRKWKEMIHPTEHSAPMIDFIMTLFLQRLKSVTIGYIDGMRKWIWDSGIECYDVYDTFADFFREIEDCIVTYPNAKIDWLGLLTAIWRKREKKGIN